MTLDERIKSFKRTFPRPPTVGSAWMIMTRLVYDLIDDREDLKTLLASRDPGKITEEEARLSKDRVLGMYDFQDRIKGEL